MVLEWIPLIPYSSFYTLWKLYKERKEKSYKTKIKHTQKRVKKDIYNILDNFTGSEYPEKYVLEIKNEFYSLKNAVNTKSREKTKENFKDMEILEKYLETYYTLESKAEETDIEVLSDIAKYMRIYYENGKIEELPKKIKYDSGLGKEFKREFRKALKKVPSDIEMKMISYENKLKEYPPIYVPEYGFVENGKWKVKRKGNKIKGKLKKNLRTLLEVDIEYKEEIDIEDIKIEYRVPHVKMFIAENPGEYKDFVKKLESTKNIIIINDIESGRTYTSKSPSSKYFSLYINGKERPKSKKDFLKTIADKNEDGLIFIDKDIFSSSFKKKDIEKIRKEIGLESYDSENKSYYVF